MEVTAVFPRKRIVSILVGLFVFVAIWAVFLQFLPEKNTAWNYYFNFSYSFLYFFAGAVAVSGATTLGKQGVLRKSLLLLGTGFMGQAIALWIWTYYNIDLTIEVPYPSLSDFFYLIFVPTIGLGLLYLLRIYQFKISRKIIIESCITFLVFSYIIFKFINIPDLSSDLTLLTKIINIVYPLSDAILLSLALAVVRVAGGKVHASLLFMVAGLLLQTTGDFVFSQRIITGQYWNGDLSDILFTCAAFVFSLGLISISTNSVRGDENVS